MWWAWFCLFCCSTLVCFSNVVILYILHRNFLRFQSILLRFISISFVLLPPPPQNLQSMPMQQGSPPAQQSPTANFQSGQQQQMSPQMQQQQMNPQMQQQMSPQMQQQVGVDGKDFIIIRASLRFNKRLNFPINPRKLSILPVFSDDREGRGTIIQYSAVLTVLECSGPEGERLAPQQTPAALCATQPIGW